MIKQTIVEELRAKKSRVNQELLDRAADDIEYLEAEAVKWHHEYHKVKEDLRQAKMYENSAHKLAEQYHEELQTAKAEIAREIFAEIERRIFFGGFTGDRPNLVIMTNRDFEDLKKKYMEDAGK